MSFQASLNFPFENLKTETEGLDEPVVFCNTKSTNSPDWELLEWDIKKFSNKMGNMELPFRVGKNKRTVNPQWEDSTLVENFTMTNFLKEVLKPENSLKWYYFDYKYANDWLQQKPEILKCFDWKKFGLNSESDETTMWIGSKGAHTLCHQDTYGCNFVRQIYGKKIWLLVSPQCTSSLKPTRIPFEESTVFSQINFFSPSSVELEAIKNLSEDIKIFMLEPGDILYVPTKWWHFVLSLDISMSVNVWVPLENDCKERLKESLTQLLAKTIPAEGSSSTANISLDQCIQYIKLSVEECKNYKKTETSLEKEARVSNNLNKSKLLKNLYPNNIKLGDIEYTDSKQCFSTYLEFVNNFSKESVEYVDSSDLNLKNNIVNAFSNPLVIETVSKILLNNYV